MVRIDEADVREIIAVNETVSLAIEIESANLLVEEHLVGNGMSDARLRLIELYLAAHFTALSEEKGGLIRTTIGESSDMVSDVYKEGLMGTRFGQAAINFDTSGRLAKVGTMRGKAEFRVV